MTDEEFRGLFESLRLENVATREETVAMREDVAAMRAESRGMRGKFTAMHLETRRHFDVVAERIDRRIDGLAEALTGVDERLTRRIGQLEDRVDRGFADTHAMIKFTHEELDRRVRALERT